MEASSELFIWKKKRKRKGSGDLIEINLNGWKERMRRMHRNRGRTNRGDIIEKEWLLVCTYRVSWHGHLYICRRATRGRSAVGDMFTGHDLLPTSATVNLGVTTSASATEAQGRQPHTETHGDLWKDAWGGAPLFSLSFFPFNVKLNWLHSFQLNSNRIICLNFFSSLSLSDDFLFNIGIVIFSLLFFFFPPLPPDKKLPREKEDDASSTNVTDLTKIRLKLRRKL